MDTDNLKITVTCGETFDILLIDENWALHENVVREYCEQHNCEPSENVYTVCWNEADDCIIKAAESELAKLI